MAFNTNPAAAGTNNDDSWKAAGFLNLYLPSKDGKRRKLGAIPLRASKSNEKALNDWLTEDPSRVAQLLSKLQLDYQSATPSDKPENQFDL